MNAENLLQQAKKAFQQGQLNYRDAMLETGRLLKEYIFESLKKLDGTTRRYRRTNKLSRESLIHQAAAELDTRNDEVSRLIQAGAVVQLMDDLGVGNLSFGSVLAFRAFIYRKPQPDGADWKPSLSETWQFRPNTETAAKELFSEAVQKSFSKSQVLDGIYKITHGKPIPKPTQENKNKFQREYRSREKRERVAKNSPTSDEARIQELKAARLASPGDIAERCMELIEAAEDPRTVAIRLQGMLDQFLARKKSKLAELLA